MDITVKYTKAAIGDPALLERLRAPMAIATATATAIRDRVRRAHVTATQAAAYKGTPTAGGGKSGTVRKAYYVSPAYATAVGLQDQTRWQSSADMHQAVGAVSGLGDVSGGMWQGLQVRNSGERAVIEFGGSSLGASSKRSALTKTKTGTYEVTLSDNGHVRARQVRELKRNEGGQVQYRRKPKLVRNAEKAGRVFKNSRVGLLQCTPTEEAAQWQAFRDATDATLARMFGRERVARPVTGDQPLYRAILRGFGF